MVAATIGGDGASIQDFNTPKLGLSVYFLFTEEQRENVREENPGVPFGQVGKILDEEVRLSDKQPFPYEAKTAADKEHYSTCCNL